MNMQKKASRARKFGLLAINIALIFGAAAIGSGLIGWVVSLARVYAR